jgi:hypothetical protein
MQNPKGCPRRWCIYDSAAERLRLRQKHLALTANIDERSEYRISVILRAVVRLNLLLTIPRLIRDSVAVKTFLRERWV